MSLERSPAEASDATLPPEDRNPDKALRTAAQKERELRVYARAEFVMATGHLALVGTDGYSEQDAQDVITTEWYAFREKYIGGENAEVRAIYLDQLDQSASSAERFALGA